MSVPLAVRVTTQTVRAGAYPARTAPRSHHTALEGTMTTPTPPDAARTPCSFPECNTDGTGEPCDRHETEQAHAEGEHEFCGTDCEVAFPTDMLRNALTATAPAGATGILAELERRAAAVTVTTPPPPVAELRQRIEAALRQAAHVCGPDCPAPDEAACHAAHPVQEAASHHGVVTDVYGPIEALATACAAVAGRVAAQAQVRDYENRISWETTCGEHARLLDACAAADERAEKAEAEATRLSLMVDEYSRGAQQLSDKLRDAKAKLTRVRDEVDRLEAAVRANPTNPEFDGAYLAPLRHIRAALGDDQPAEQQPGDLPTDPALAEIERLAVELYRAEDTLAWIGELCDIADREGTPVTTARVRIWLKGPQCARQAAQQDHDGA